MRAPLASLLGACLAVALASPAHAAGPVDVAFLQSDAYSDAGRDPLERSRAEERLARYLQGLGSRWLADGQALKIDVLDLDIGGELRPRRAGNLNDLRIASNNDARQPHITMRYSLTQNGAVVTSGEETVTDLAYLRHGADIAGADDPLYQEKRMLQAWFKQRIVERKPAG
jgi:hypothetical protein